MDYETGSLKPSKCDCWWRISAEQAACTGALQDSASTLLYFPVFMNDPENIYKFLPVKLAADWDFALINKAEGRALLQSLGGWQQGDSESEPRQVL